MMAGLMFDHYGGDVIAWPQHPRDHWMQAATEV